MAESRRDSPLVDPQYSPQSRAERLIAAARVVLAAFAFLGIWLDPSEPTRYVRTAYALLAVYIGYALLAAFLVWRSAAPPGRQTFAMHAFDLAVFSLFMFFTQGPTSPFFVFFVFSLACGTLRWQWRGTLWTAAATLALFLGMGVYAAQVIGDPAFELNRFIVRSAYLAVVAALLAYLGLYEERRRGEISRLATWPLGAPQEVRSLAREMLEHAAAVLGAPRALLAWEEPEEPGLRLACWSGGELQWSRESPGALQPLVAEPLAGTDLLCRDIRAPRPAVFHTSDQGFRRWEGRPLHPDLAARFGVGAVLALGLKGEGFEGRLFALDKAGMTSDDLVLGGIVARQVVARLDRFYLLQRLQQAAATEERVRLARDLHDGVLQSLTGAALQLETASHLLEEDPGGARQRLAEVQRLIAAEQRDLRSFVQQLKPAPLAPFEVEASLVARLKELAHRMERQWGLRVALDVQPIDGGISEGLSHEIYRMVHEALINTARHAGASTGRVEIAGRDDQVRITVADDGHGFPFHGRYDHAA
ncbi:MAG: sensor histidine kinase, partial [Candidatus Rokubacteria bacterium]|nr:sensor histidine kinase [Candidatus Rokubacteria bacterium]